MKNLLFLILISFNIVFAQSSLLQSGPMVGYAEMKEVCLWVQTKEQAEVKIVYYDKLKPSFKLQTETIKTEKKYAYTAKLIADQVEPGLRYTYELFINNKRVNCPYPLEFQTLKQWLFRTDAPDFKLALGSCSYINQPEYDRPGKGYGSDYKIFTSISDKKPDAMFWLGDNVYLREADWNSRTGVFARYTHTRSTPEMQPLFGSIHHYAIWDDHDYGPNDSDRSFWNKNTTLDAFKSFWCNPSFGVNNLGGITTQFEWGDAQFFGLDNRWFRSPQKRVGIDSSLLGQEQLNWLIDALVSSKATFKIIAIGGQTLNPLKKYENYSNYEKERKQLLEAIELNNIKGVFFLSGDRHHTELSKLDRLNNYPIYDLTVSALTAGGPEELKEENPYRVQGTGTVGQNFATLDFKGPKATRTMTISVFDKEGKLLWTKDILASELK